MPIGIEIYLEAEKTWVDMKDVRPASENQNIVKLFNYFVALLKLFSNICFQRNFEGIELLQSQLPYSLCYKAITSEKLHPDIQQAFVMVLRDIWVNTPDYPLIQVPRLIKVFKEMDGELIFPSTDLDISLFDELKEYQMEYFNSICHKIGDISLNEVEL